MGDDLDQPATSPQAQEAAAYHLDWRCDHFHQGPGPPTVGPASCPHRHAPFQQTTLDISADLLGFNPVRWVIEWAGPRLGCRGIEVTERDPLGGRVAGAGNAVGTEEPVAARLRRWL